MLSRSRHMFVLGALCALAGVLCAQSNLATVTGVVTDAQNAVVPAAAVTIRNTSNNNSRTMQTSEAGSFTFTALQPGDYELTVESAGFRSYVQQGIVLRVGQTLRADVQLELGAVAETVTVDAQLVAINTENGTIKGDVIVQEEIQELPLNGRDFTDLAFFTPGVVPKASGGQGSAFNINGARASNTNFFVDGFDNRNARGAAAQVRPNIDALQEFKMEVSGYSAEYGRMAGGIMNMVLRSGTNEFHGNLNYYLRNDIFDARGFFEEDNNALRQHQFAATVAGPIVKDKTFFMGSYEGVRRTEDLTRLTRVPTDLERQGDFSQSLNVVGDPLYLRDRLASGPCNANNQQSCFPNNVIPAGRLDAVGQNVIERGFPLPNRPAGATGFNFLTIAPDKDIWDSYLFKIDQKLGENNLAFRYQVRYNDTQNPFSGSDLGNFGHDINDNRSMGGVDYTHMFSPTLLLEVRGGFTRNSAYLQGFFAGRDVAGELGLPNLIPEGESANTPELLDWPRFVVTNYANVGTGANMPVQFHVTDWQYGFKLTWIKGNHNLKWGLNSNFVQFNQPFYNNQRGTYRFLGNRTGHPVADLTLGWLQNVNRQSGFNRNYWRQHALGTFINDDWKTTRKLTLNLGLRWEVNRAPWDKYDRLGVYDTSSLQLILADDANAPADYQELLDETGLRGVIATADMMGRPRSVVSTDWLNVSPRVGFAYRMADRTVLRGGYGIFMAGDILNNLRNNLSNQFPFAVIQNFPGQNADPDLVSLANPFPKDRETLQGTTNTRGYTLDPSQAYLQSWNLTVERELRGGMSIELDYRGSKGTHLLRLYDFNQPFRTLDSFIAGEGFARPIPEWNAINMFSTGSISNYNAFNVSWRKRSRGGLFWRVNYSFSKSIDDASQANGQSEGGFANALDSRNLRLDRARSDWDRRHVFTAIGNYELPVGQGRRWGSDWPGVVRALVGGWQLSGTVSAYSGSPFTVETSNANLNFGGSPRPNRLGEGSLPADYAPGRKGVDFPWYDLAAFEPVPCHIEDPADAPAGCVQSAAGFSPFAFGTSGRNILDGPGLFSINASLSKNFRLAEGHNLQLRLETFNMLNRPNFLITDELTLFNSLTGGLLSRTGAVGREGGPRIFQYAVKYRF